jgi:hypothetical protein
MTLSDGLSFSRSSPGIQFSLGYSFNIGILSFGTKGNTGNFHHCLDSKHIVPEDSVISLPKSLSVGF